MEADLPSQYRPIPGSFGGTRAPLHGIRVDAERKRERIRRKKSRCQSTAIGALARKRIKFWLTRVQLLDISLGLSFLHSLEIVHGGLKGVRLGFFPYHISVGNNLTISRPRMMFSLTGQVVRASVTSGSPALPASSVRRLQRQGSGDPTNANGWPPSSSAPAAENPASPHADQTPLLWAWSLLR